jgi:O-antigen ligase
MTGQDTQDNDAPRSAGHVVTPRADAPRLAGWTRLLDLDVLYQWITFLIIPVYAIAPQVRSQIFVAYMVLFVFKVRRDGYVRCGLEYPVGVALLGLAASFVGNWDAGIISRVLAVARILTLPLLMCQYKPIRRPENALACIFSGLAAYGLVRMFFAPLITGYAQDRAYCYSDFFMHSSVIAFSGYLFFLVMLIRKGGRGWKVLSAANVLGFVVLVLMHHCRASYLALILITPVILLAEFRRRAVLVLVFLLLSASVVLGVLYSVRPALVRSVAGTVASIADSGNGSNRGRIVFWKKAVEVFAEHPVNGIGYRHFNRDHVALGNVEFNWAFWHAHNEYVSILAETGLIGILAWLAFKFSLLARLIRGRKDLLGGFILYLFLAFEVHNVFECYLYERIAYIFIYVLIGLGLNQIVAKPAPAPCRAVPPGGA